MIRNRTGLFNSLRLNFFTDRPWGSRWYSLAFVLIPAVCGHVTGSARDEADEAEHDCYGPWQLQH